MSPEINKDIAADRGIDFVIIDQIFNESKVEYFDFLYYWKTIKGMEEDIEEDWKDVVVIPEEVIRRAHMLFNKHHPQTKNCVRVRMKLGKYKKQS